MAVAEKAEAEKFYSKLEKGLELLEGIGDTHAAFQQTHLVGTRLGDTPMERVIRDSAELAVEMCIRDRLWTPAVTMALLPLPPVKA